MSAAPAATHVFVIIGSGSAGRRSGPSSQVLERRLSPVHTGVRIWVAPGQTPICGKASILPTALAAWTTALSRVLRPCSAPGPFVSLRAACTTHCRQQLLWLEVTRHPTPEWLAQRLPGASLGRRPIVRQRPRLRSLEYPRRPDFAQWFNHGSGALHVRNP